VTEGGGANWLLDLKGKTARSPLSFAGEDEGARVHGTAAGETAWPGSRGCGVAAGRARACLAMAKGRESLVAGEEMEQDDRRGATA
jgi:hypothetical protein